MNRYSSYKDSGINWIGNIPRGWNVTKASHVFDNFGSGTTPSDNPLYYSDNGEVNWLITGDLNDSHIRTTSKHLNKKAIIDYPTLRIFKPGALVIAMYGATIGKVGLLDIPCCTNQACCVIESNSMDMEFYRYYFMGIKENLILMARGGGQPNISQKIIKDFPVIIPSLSEQQAIASYLDSATSKIDAAIAREQKMIDLLNERKQIIINNAVTKGLNPNAKFKDSGIDWIGEIPENWEVHKLKYLTIDDRYSIKTGPFGTQLKGADLLPEGDIIVYNQRNVLDNDFNDIHFYVSREKAKELESFITRPNDILITSRGTIGKCAILPEGKPMGILHPCLIAIRVDQKKCYPEWLRTYINDARPFITEIKLASNATTIDVIYTNTLKNILLPVPPLEEQKEIVKYISEHTKDIEITIKKAKQIISLLQERKQIIINDVVTGKIKVC